MKRKIIILNIIIMLLGGCFKPRIIHEKVNYPKKTRSGIKYIRSKTDLKRIAWWKKLNNTELNQLISQALSSNNQIKASYATIEQAQAQLKAAHYAWAPTLDANANGFSGGTWNSHAIPKGQLANSPFFKNLSPLRFRGYDTGFVPGYTLNILNNINNIKSAKASLVIQQAEAQATKLSIISQMAGTYFMLISQREQLSVEKALILQMKKLRQLEQVRFQKGASTIETITTMNQQLAQEEAKIPQIERVIEQSENTIHLLLNQNPAPISTHQTLLSLKLDPLFPKYLPSSVLKNRPDIMIALNNLKIAYAQIGIAYSAFFPLISLTGLVGEASLDLRNLLKINPNLWLVQGAASMNILNGSAYQNIKSAKAAFKSTYFNYLETLRAAFGEVDDALTTEQKNKISFFYVQKGYLAAKETYDIALAQYKAGAKDYRNVINEKINLDKTQLSLIQEKAQLLDSIVQVYNSVAAGYDVT